MARALTRISRLRSTLLEQLQALDPALLTAHPIPGKWSILEIVEHLVLAEEAVFYGQKGLDGEAVPRRTIRNLALYWVVMGVLVFGIPVRVPSRTMRPKGERTLDALADAWERSQERLGRHVRELDRRGLSLPIFSHPVSGPMSTRQAIWMLEAHLRRHRRQIRGRVRLLTRS
ncbi:MAG: DinB family protein [Gemmatimonadota bacterium]